jgi:agmatinase
MKAKNSTPCLDRVSERGQKAFMTHFDPNAAATADSGVFGLPYSEADATLVYLPVPWEATTSYGGGTSQGPHAILQASRQVDLFDLDVVRPYEAGLFMLSESEKIRKWNEEAKALAQEIIEVGGQIEGNPKLANALKTVNSLGDQLNQYVFEETRRLLNQGKLVGLVGGDHSVPYGAIRAMGEKIGNFGVLHFDAHSDTRKAYEGFTWSHASIMYNVMKDLKQVTHLTQVGIRDICEEEVDFVNSQKGRISVFYDSYLARKKFDGSSWKMISDEIISTLPQKVWISFDIDGLDPRFCPHTGTPVPGGLDFHEAIYLVLAVVKSGREIVGFDLNEVAPNLSDESDEWDANVGARLLYKLSAFTLASQRKAQLHSPIDRP